MVCFVPCWSSLEVTRPHLHAAKKKKIKIKVCYTIRCPLVFSRSVKTLGAEGGAGLICAFADDHVVYGSPATPSPAGFVLLSRLPAAQVRPWHACTTSPDRLLFSLQPGGGAALGPAAVFCSHAANKQKLALALRLSAPSPRRAPPRLRPAPCRPSTAAP